MHRPAGNRCDSLWTLYLQLVLCESGQDVLNSLVIGEIYSFVKTLEIYLFFLPKLLKVDDELLVQLYCSLKLLPL